MRACWIDSGNDPDYAKLSANAINAAYFDIREPRLSVGYLQGVKAKGLAVGVYAVASWWPTLTGSQFADKVSKQLGAIAPDSTSDFPMVCLDIERDDVRGYLIPALQEWRRRRPDRVTDLTIEGHKGALFSPSDVIHVAAKTRYVVPQCYDGAMTQVWDTYAMAANLTDAGFPIGSVCPFYDAAHLPEWWGIPNGYTFTQGRLP